MSIELAYGDPVLSMRIVPAVLVVAIVERHFTTP